MLRMRVADLSRLSDKHIMKKIFFMGFLLMIVSMITTGCSSCQSENNKQELIINDYDGVIQDFTASVENITALHRQIVFEVVGDQQINWYETRAIFNDTITFENLDDLHIVDINNVFQTFDPDLCWQVTSNVKYGTMLPSPVPGLWIEDFDLNRAEIDLSVEDVLQRLQEWDGILPPAKQITLRKPVGPKECNAQYVIGNIAEVIWIDAVTGDIRNTCPAFEP